MSLKQKSVIGLILIMSMIVFGACSPKEDVAVGDGGEIVYWTNWNETEAQAKVLKEAAAEFKELTGTTVNIQWMGREINKVGQPAIESGEVMDLISTNYLIVGGAIAPSGLLMPIDEYVAAESSTTGIKDFINDGNQKYIDLIVDIVGDGKLYGLPYQPFIQTYFYSTEAFDKAGITETPETWTDFLDVCAKLKAAGYDPITVDDAYYNYLFLNHLNRLVGLEEVNRILNEEDWDNPAILQLAKDYEELASMGYISEFASSNKYPAGQQEVALGTAAMYFNGSWLPNELIGTAGADFGWGAFNYPVIEGGFGDQTITQYGCQMFGVPITAKNPEMAVEFMKFVSTGKWDQELAQRSHGIPMDPASEWPPLLEGIKPTYESLTVQESISTANQPAQAIMKSEFSKLIGGSITAEDFVNALK